MRSFECHSCDIGRIPVIITKADTFLKRFKGLAYRAGTDTALWIVPCGSIHTFWMRFDLHVLFLDENGKVLKVRADVPARRVISCRGAKSVLEIPSQLLARKFLPCEGTLLSFYEADR